MVSQLVRLAAVLAAVLAVSAACGSPALPSLGASVPILTGKPNGIAMGGAVDGKIIGCYTNWVDGKLVRDATHGTAVTRTDGSGPPVIVAWPVGFRAREAGAEVAVVDPAGAVVATTGRQYRLPGGSVTGDAEHFAGLPDDPVFFACWAWER
jgi:hypothetical protein